MEKNNNNSSNSLVFGRWPHAKLLKVNTNETQSITPFKQLSRCSSYAAPCWLKRFLEWLLHGSVN